MFAGVFEGGLGEQAGDAGPAQRFGDLSFKQPKHIARQGVVECGRVAVLLQFKTTGRYEFRCALFLAEQAHCRASIASGLSVRKYSRIAWAWDFVTTAESAAT